MSHAREPHAENPSLGEGSADRFDRVLNDEQITEFAERGFILIPQVVAAETLARASSRIDGIIAADPPAEGKTGHHFYFLPVADEPALAATVTDTDVLGYAQALTGPGTLGMFKHLQVALNIPPFPHRPGCPHIDASNDQPIDEPVRGTFTLLAAVLMSDQTTENSGNLWVWPGTHLRHAAYFRENGPRKFCAYPPIELPEPEQVTGRAGDLLLAHYLLGHNIGGNYKSDQTRRALYFRYKAQDHDTHRAEFLQDAWLEYEPVRSAASRPSSG